MSSIVVWTAFDGDGVPTNPISSGQISLPDELDWRSIEAKEVYLRYMGGFPCDAQHLVISSQGEKRLISNLGDATAPQDYKQRRSKEDGWLSEIERRCEERGIDLVGRPRNQ